MACACRSGKKTANQPFVVALPGGQKKSFASGVAAQALVDRTEGAYLIPPQPVST